MEKGKQKEKPMPDKEFPPTIQYIKDIGDWFYAVECDAQRIDDKCLRVTSSLLIALGDITEIIRKYTARDEITDAGMNPDITKDLVRLLDRIVTDTQTLNNCRIHIDGLRNTCELAKEDVDVLASRAKKKKKGSKNESRAKRKS